MKDEQGIPKDFMEFAAILKGPPDLSSRKGFATHAEKESNDRDAPKTAKKKKTRRRATSVR